MASRLDIANRALSKLGAARISSLDEGSREANAVKAAYDALFKEELQRNVWTFAIKRVQLSADSTAPAFGRSNRFQLPADYLRKAPIDPFRAPWPDDALFEGRFLLTDEAAPLNIRYVSSDVEEETFDPLFAGALAARIAYELCEEITQSAAKKRELADDYKFHVSQAKSTNAIQSGPQEPEIDEWVGVRGIPSQYWW